MVGRLVEQQDVGFRRHHLGKRCASRFAAGKVVGLLLAGQAEMIEQVGNAMRVVGRAETGLDISPHGGEAFHVGRLRQIADRGGRLAEHLAVLRLDHTGRDLQQRSTCRNRCGRPARSCRPAEADSAAPSSSGVPPKVELDIVEPKKRWRHDRLEVRNRERDGRSASRGRC